MEERKSRYELFLEEEESEAQLTKRCAKCKEVKVLNEFHKGKYQCKVCRATRNKYRSADDWFWKHFWSKTTRDGNCLVWSGYEHRNRLICQRGKRKINVRRFVYQQAVGDLPSDMKVIMTCTTKNCVSQFHMRAGTQEDLYVKLRNNQPNGADHYLNRRPELRKKGEFHPNSVLTKQDVCNIRQIYASGKHTYTFIATQIGVSRKTITDIIHRKTWTHVE